MLPLITITDAPTARLIAAALRENADAKRRTADRLASAAYGAVAAANVRNANRLSTHAMRLDRVATECERQAVALEAESDDYDTVVIPRVSDAQCALFPVVVP